MSWLSNLVGDVTKGVEQVVPGAKQLDQFLNKAGIGPADAFQNPFKPQGWAGDIEHGLSQASHSPAGRALEEAAAIAAMAYFAPEMIGSVGSMFGAGAGAAAGVDDATLEAYQMLSGLDAAGNAVGDVGAATSAGANLAAETANAGTAIPDAGTAATTAAAAPGGMPELTVNAARTGGQGLYAAANMLPFAAAAAAGQPGMPQSRTPQLKSASDVQISDVPPPATPDLLSTFGATAPGAGLEPGAGGSVFGPTPLPDAGGGGMIDDATLQAYQDLTGLDSAGNPINPSWLSKLGSYVTTPKGALTTGMLGMSALNALRSPKLPASAQQAANIASQNAAQAQVVITSGGQGTPLWGQQKAAIDASIDEQIQNATAAIQQTMQNTSGQGGNSAAVQAQIADVTGQLEAQRQILYQQALQQNVTNALNELSGADSTLMAVGQLQYQESADAKQLAAQLAEMAGWLNVNWSGGTGGIKQPTQPTVPTGMPGS